MCFVPFHKCKPKNIESACMQESKIWTHVLTKLLLGTKCHSSGGNSTSVKFPPPQPHFLNPKFHYRIDKSPQIVLLWVKWIPLRSPETHPNIILPSMPRSLLPFSLHSSFFLINRMLTWWTVTCSVNVRLQNAVKLNYLQKWIYYKLQHSLQNSDRNWRRVTWTLIHQWFHHLKKTTSQHCLCKWTCWYAGITHDLADRVCERLV